MKTFISIWALSMLGFVMLTAGVSSPEANQATSVALPKAALTAETHPRTDPLLAIVPQDALSVGTCCQYLADPVAY